MKKPLLTLASAILLTLPSLNWAQPAPAVAPATATPNNTSAAPKAEKKAKKAKKKKAKKAKAA